MIPIYEFELNEREGPEQRLARKMGKPPYPPIPLSKGTPVHTFAAQVAEPVVAIIFDPYFWYPAACWESWLAALQKFGTDGFVNVPLGNQDLQWSQEIFPPLYMTLRGAELAAQYKGAQTWRMAKIKRASSLCLAAIPHHLLEQCPQHMSVSELPGYLVEHKTQIRIYCQGWLHSFTAVEQAGCRHDLLTLTDWRGMVLELGCGKGFMAQTCKQQNQEVTWIGLDIEHGVLEQGKRHLDLAIRADASAPLPLKNVKFDTIVCADFLEHVHEPEDLLARLHQFIKPKGVLIASVPNIGHWMVVDDLLHGRWDPAPSGVLCISHLRFGTRATWENVFHQGGWNITHMQTDRLEMPIEWKDKIRGMITNPDIESLETIAFKILARPV